MIPCTAESARSYGGPEPVTGELHTLDDLVALLDRFDHPLIMDKLDGDGRLHITIYDDYLE